MSSQASPPAEPNYAAANQAAINAQLDNLPSQIGVERAAQLGNAYTYTDSNGQSHTVDFTGMGDSSIIANQLASAQQSAPALAQLQLGIQQQYDPQFIAQSRADLQQADPTGFALNEQFKQQALDDLNQGTNLSDQQTRNIQQSTRAAQTSRGNIYGAAPSAEEAFNMFSSGEALKAQRQQVAATALGLGNTSQQFAGLQGASSGASPFATMQPNENLSYINQNAGAQGAQFALGKYQGDLQQYQLKSTVGDPVNRWAGIAGTVIGAAATAFCWVAREIYGADNPDWMLFREWMLNEAPIWFVNLYRTYGERFALWVSNKPRIKSIIRWWMDGKIKTLKGIRYAGHI